MLQGIYLDKILLCMRKNNRYIFISIHDFKSMTTLFIFDCLWQVIVESLIFNYLVSNIAVFLSSDKNLSNVKYIGG